MALTIWNDTMLIPTLWSLSEMGVQFNQADKDSLTQVIST